MSLEFVNVSYEYESNTPYSSKAIENIDLKIEDGVFYALIGHTGSGKSTLIQHMNGLLTPTMGEVRIDGMNIADRSVSLKEVRSKVGLVFQYPEHQLFEATVYDDVCFGPKNMGLSEDEIKERAETALIGVGLKEDMWKSSPFELSGGQKRRAAIAGVLAMRPKILVLDEPTAGLDPAGRDDILDQIRDLHKKENMTVVLVSHSMEDVANYADRIIVMNRGHIEYNDSPVEVFRHAAELKKMGLSVPQVTDILKRLHDKGYDVSESALTTDQAADEIMRAIGKIQGNKC